MAGRETISETVGVSERRLVWPARLAVRAEATGSEHPGRSRPTPEPAAGLIGTGCMHERPTVERQSTASPPTFSFPLARHVSTPA